MQSTNRRQMEFAVFLAVAAIAVLIAIGLSRTPGQRNLAELSTFVAEKSCEATRAIRGGDPVAIEAGASYPARSINRTTGATHALIEIEGEAKWVRLDCGRLEASGADVAARTGDELSTRAGADTAARERGSTERGGICLPFFDDDDNPIPRAAAFGGKADITPKSPKLDEFDRALMAVCGPAGKVVPADEFKTLMRSHPAVLDRLRAFTGGRVFAGSSVQGSRETYLSDLTEAWFAVKAFDHIFCGEPNPSGEGIGGLHFHGRYLQLQQSGEACRMPNYAQNEIVPGVVYTMGVEMRARNGVMARHARKGYGLTMSGEDILKSVTRAFVENPTSSSESQGCLLSIEDDGVSFDAVFVRRASGIRTFYPDATPNGRGSKPNPPCAGRVALPPG